MTQALNQKLPNTSTTIFTVMSALAQQHDAINLAQGFPDFEPPVQLRQRVAWHVNHGHNQYAPMQGIAPLRAAIADQLATHYGSEFDPNTEITVTSGATEALFSALAAFAGPGDEVVVFDPAYDSYDPAIRLAGATPVHVALKPVDFRIDFAELAAAVSDKTQLIVINSPHNPTSSLITGEDLDALADLAEAHDCLVLSDEVYANIVFDGVRHTSVIQHSRLATRSLAVFSFGKTFHATGWKIGYAVGPRELTAALQSVHQYNTFTTATPLQWALADFLNAEPDFALTLGGFYQQKRDLFSHALRDSRFSLAPSQGSYFQLANYAAISDLPDTEFANWLTRDIGVAAIPISVFYAEPPPQSWVRFCFAKEDATLSTAAAKLAAI